MVEDLTDEIRQRVENDSDLDVDSNEDRADGPLFTVDDNGDE